MKRSGKYASVVFAVVFWLAVWQAAAMLIKEKLFLASPLSVLTALWGLLGTRGFYSTVGFSLARVAIAFFAALILGCALAVAAYKSAFFRTLFLPLMGLAKSAPAAAFTIIFLLIFGSKNIALPVVFIMVLPIFYSNTLAGLKSVDPERFEAAAVFGMARRDRFRFIYMPYVAPFFASSCEVGWGMAWKAGVSAEVIAITAGSIGGKIYDVKTNYETAELFAYTLVVIALSLLFERATAAVVRELTMNN